MPTTPPDATSPALDALRRPIYDYKPEDSAGRTFRIGMLGLLDLLEELLDDDDGGGLEGDAVWTALQAFPGLIAPGPSPTELVELALGGHLIDAETADTLHTLGTIRRILRGFEPPGFAAAVWRAALLAIYQLIELFVVLGDERLTDQCLQLLDTAESMADAFAGRS